MEAPLHFRTHLSAAFSILAHALLLVVLAFTSVHIVAQDRAIIPLIIRDSAPPPPPLGGGSGTGPPLPSAPIAAPAEPATAVEQPKPIEAPRPAQHLKIAARPKPKQDTARQQPTAAAAQPETQTATAPAEPSGAAGPGVPGGEIGGVAGGQIGGKVGGRIGGTGDDLGGGRSPAPLKVLYAVRPKYPPMALSRLLEGVVVVQAEIDGHGLVKGDTVQVVKSQPPFDEPAVAAFRQWKFDPGSAGGGQVVTVPIRFHLRD